MVTPITTQIAKTIVPPMNTSLLRVLAAVADKVFRTISSQGERQHLEKNYLHKKHLSLSEGLSNHLHSSGKWTLGVSACCAAVGYSALGSSYKIPETFHSGIQATVSGWQNGKQALLSSQKEETTLAQQNQQERSPFDSLKESIASLVREQGQALQSAAHGT